MKRIVTSFLGAALLLTLSATLAGAAYKYPPGPAYRSCPDTLTVFDTQQADTTIALCHPAVLDTVLGLRGIVTGYDVRASAFAFWVQTAGGGQFTGIQAFTGATNYNGPVAASPSGGNLVYGDEVVVYGTMQEFPSANGTTEIEGPDVIQSTNDIVVRRISSGNAVPMDIVTTAQLNWLPAFSQGERYEGGLVRIRGPLKVGRISGTGVQTGNYLLTTVAVSTDSVLIDNFTLSPTLGGPAPSVGTIVDSVQGIVQQNNSSAGTGTINSYRIQLRTGNDVFLAVPPNLSDAYPIEDAQLRLVFDRNVDQTTAEDESKYDLGSAIDGSTVDLAVMEAVPGNVVILTITNPTVASGDLETIGVLGVGSASCPTCVITPKQTRTFVNGVLTCAEVQAPDPADLTLFDDRSRFAGPGALSGDKLTFRGIAVKQFGTLYYIVDEAGGIRSGLSVFGPTQPLVAGRRYRVTGQVQEFGSETEIVSTAQIVDEGPGTIPASVLETVAVLRDTTTDMAGTPLDPDGATLTGEDYECMLVTAALVKVTETRTIGQSFFVAGQRPSFPDTILVSNLSGTLNAYTPPDSGTWITVTGLLHFSNGIFRICPRDAGDIDLKTVGVGGNSGLQQVEFSVAPNPARASVISFGLPRHDRVELGIFDLQGRQLVMLARGDLPAGQYTRKWNGMDASGKRVNPGVYFYRLKVGSEIRTLRGVLLQ